MWQKIKHQKDWESILIIVIIILVGFGSFGLGRLSAITHKPPVSLTGMTASASGDIPTNAEQKDDKASATTGAYVGSKSGTKYHLPWCSGAQRIKEENKVWFSTKEEAERMGYSPAANCKGI